LNVLPFAEATGNSAVNPTALSSAIEEVEILATLALIGLIGAGLYYYLTRVRGARMPPLFTMGISLLFSTTGCFMAVHNTLTVSAILMASLILTGFYAVDLKVRASVMQARQTLSARKPLLVRILKSPIGQTSIGVRLGFIYGFDSGVMLAYFYENKVQNEAFIRTLASEDGKANQILAQRNTIGGRLLGYLVDWAFIHTPMARALRLRQSKLSALLPLLLISFLDSCCGNGLSGMFLGSKPRIFWRRARIGPNLEWMMRCRENIW